MVVGDEPVLVVLEANIGAGKTTLLDAVDAMGHPDILVVKEPVERWCAPALSDGRSMLRAYYDAPRETGLAFQMYTMLTRAQQLSVALSRARASPSVKIVLSERCPWSDYEIFGRPMHTQLGLLSEPEWFSYTAWFHAITQEQEGCGGLMLQGVRPAGLVYLKCHPGTCRHRIETRNRSGEQTISDDYLAMLHAAHETHVADASAPGSGYRGIVVLDGDREGEEAVRDAAERVVCFARGISLLNLAT
jgi:deoxyadenosine/deoxycytidine kinase